MDLIEQVKDRARFLYINEQNHDLHKCIDQAADELITPSKLSEFVQEFDIDRNELVSSVYRNMSKEGV